MKKTVGIIGGVGPLATADLFRKIILATDARSDQEHLHVIVDSDPSVPDRTEAILHGGEDPAPYLIRSARRLETAGAEVLAMPCCTGHVFLDRVRRETGMHIADMLRETAAYLARKGVKRAGLLATDGALAAGLFERELAQAGIDVLKPTLEEQAAVTDMIYNTVKAGRTDRDPGDFIAAVNAIYARGAGIIVAGCTELPMAFDRYCPGLAYADPTAILARAVVVQAGAAAKPE